MDYKETLEYMYSQLPMFHRVGKAAYKANLDNARALDELCGFPHRNYKTVHIAGTNGKGSVSHMLAAVLQKSGYKTGLFTSPHLVDFRERIRVNGEMIPEHAVVDFVLQFKQNFEVLKPSFFEMTSALAFQYFADAKVDIAVIETGLGGRLDSTNIISPLLSVITNIGLDHTDLLGDTLTKIAGEKAGIIKKQVSVVIGETLPETKEVFETVARTMNAEIRFADQYYKASFVEEENADVQKIWVEKRAMNGEIYELDLKGLYQVKNICTVLSATDVLKAAGLELNIHAGLKTAGKATGLLGRWQVLSEAPLIVCDTGHNRDGISWVVSQIKRMKYSKLHFVFGVVNDKDVSKVLPLLPGDAIYYFTRAAIPRAMDESELKQKAGDAGLKGESYPTVAEAIKKAKKNAAPNDLIFIGGSTFVVADALMAERKN